jgi:hypothetical protein
MPEDLAANLAGGLRLFSVCIKPKDPAGFVKAAAAHRNVEERPMTKEGTPVSSTGAWSSDLSMELLVQPPCNRFWAGRNHLPRNALSQPRRDTGVRAEPTVNGASSMEFGPRIIDSLGKNIAGKEIAILFVALREIAAVGYKVLHLIV